MKEFIHTMLKKAGIDIMRFPNNDLARRIKIVKNHKIDTLLDVGANIGQYGKEMRLIGYENKIISFEPLAEAFCRLKKLANKDKNWITYNYAVGDEDTKSIINTARNSVSSSILNILPNHTTSAPDSVYTNKQEIEIKKLDSIFNSLSEIENNVMVKIDTQGYEKNVLEGATASLKSIKIIQLEMSIIPLYENEILFREMIDYLDQKGFTLASLENGFSDKSTGHLLQVDGIFLNKNL